MAEPLRGQIWLVDLGEPLGHEPGYVRPAVVVSDDRFNAYGLVIVCPLTRSRRDYPTRVELEPAESGVDEVSYIQVEQVRTISSRRLLHPMERVPADALAQVERILRLLFRL